MNQDLLRQRCEAMATDELIRALTLEADENSDRFRQTALQALEARGIELDDFVEQITMQLNNSGAETLEVSAAVERIDESLPLWDVLVLTSSLGDALALQREPAHWTVHVYESEAYSSSFFVDSQAELRNFASSFLRLEGIAPAGPAYQLDNWEVVLESDSLELVEKATAELDRANILHTVQIPLFSGDEEGYLSVIVSPDDVDAANEAIDESAENLEDMYEQATKLFAGGDRMAELAFYDRLVVEAPENPAVFYNRGYLLLELRRFDESVDALCEAVAIGIKSTDKQLEVADAGGGGLFGLVALLLRQGGSSSKTEKPDIRYPDYVDDAEMILIDLETRLPDNTKLLHSLASIARLKNDIQAAEARYRRILEIDADDRIAYFNLGYLHSEKGGEGGKLD
jgi:tetratricopeptide (TPR) repeat protein